MAWQTRIPAPALLLVAGGLVAATMGSGVRPAAAAPKVRWLTNVGAAQKQAVSSKRLVMVEFYTDACTYCKQMERETFPEAGVVTELTTHFVPVKLNAEKDGLALARRYEVSQYPTLLFLNAKGQEVTRMMGFLPARSFTAALRAIRQQRAAGR